MNTHNTRQDSAIDYGKAVPTRAAWTLRQAAWSTIGVVGFALLTGVSARLYVPLPHTPVPITLQTLMVLLTAVALGPRLGLASMSLYLALGLTGWPVFTITGGGTAGYLVGFFLAQPLVGLLAKPGEKSLAKLLVVMLAGLAVVYAFGLAWLALWLGAAANVWTVLSMGLLPFIPGMLVKLGLATTAAPMLLAKARRRFDPYC